MRINNKSKDKILRLGGKILSGAMNTFLIYYIIKWTGRDQDNLGAATASAISIPKNVKMPVFVKSTACFNPVLETERENSLGFSLLQKPALLGQPPSHLQHIHIPFSQNCAFWCCSHLQQSKAQCCSCWHWTTSAAQPAADRQATPLVLCGN